ncbi:MAG: ROK family transcriptional regulator [Clostridiaceae bacterium]|nr:ROK family transcriptional regulator [Clostridiaceae bacterium]
MLQINEAIGNVQLMQKINRLKVLHYIRRHKGVARPEIAKNTGLSPSSVTNIVTYLLEKKLVVETGRVDSKEVGRKAVLIKFNSLAANLISVNIEINKIAIAVTDLDGNIVRKNEINLLKKEREDQILKEIEKGISSIMNDKQKSSDSEKAIGTENVIGIGIAVSGLVIDDERLEISASMQWKGLSLREYFEKLFNLPVFIQNNSKTKALAVLRQNGVAPDENVIFLDLAMGVGMINLYENEINEAVIGEIGHTTVKKDGPECFCGNRGCLEVMCSVDAIINQCKDLLRAGRCSVLREILKEKSNEVKAGEMMSNGTPDVLEVFEDLEYLDDKDIEDIEQHISYEAILEAFDEGDIDVEKVFDECGEYLGIGIANIINIFKPTRIIIDGDILLESDFIYERALTEARKRAYGQFTKNLKINKVKIDTEKAIKGISFYVADKIFDLMGPEIYF